MKKQSNSKLKMVEKDGKKVPFYAADGEGKMKKGGKVKKMKSGGMSCGGKTKKMKSGGSTSCGGKAKGYKSGGGIKMRGVGCAQRGTKMRGPTA